VLLGRLAHAQHTVVVAQRVAQHRLPGRPAEVLRDRLHRAGAPRREDDGVVALARLKVPQHQLARTPHHLRRALARGVPAVRVAERAREHRVGVAPRLRRCAQRRARVVQVDLIAREVRKVRRDRRQPAAVAVAWVPPGKRGIGRICGGIGRTGRIGPGRRRRRAARRAPRDPSPGRVRLARGPSPDHPPPRRCRRRAQQQQQCREQREREHAAAVR